jgi:hypothetical protein
MAIKAGMFSKNLCFKAFWKLIIIVSLAGVIIPAGFPAWSDGIASRIARAGKLLYELTTKSIPILGTWVYMVSAVVPDGPCLEVPNGVLSGFVHDPASIFGNSSGSGINAYGGIRLSPSLKITPDALLNLTITALPKQKEH